MTHPTQLRPLSLALFAAFAATSAETWAQESRSLTLNPVVVTGSRAEAARSLRTTAQSITTQAQIRMPASASGEATGTKRRR